MWKAILFDLDGVLISNTKQLHFQALNDAILEIAGSEFVISEKMQAHRFEALTTKSKLQILSEDYGLSKELVEPISVRKQELTALLLSTLTYPNRFKFIKKLNDRGIRVGVCTNTIKSSAYKILSELNIFNLVDLVLTNEDVKQPKPNAEIYTTAMSILGVAPEECLIVEDSAPGVLAAERSGAWVYQIQENEPLESLSFSRLFTAIKEKQCYYSVMESSVTHTLSRKFIGQTRVNRATYAIKIKCDECQRYRFVAFSNLHRSKNNLCFPCASSKNGLLNRGVNNPNYKLVKINRHGYVIKNINELTDDEKKLALAMKQVNRWTTNVLEHRLVMAKYLGRPLEKHEIVHHKNGQRADNRLENLELLTTQTHHHGHGDEIYQKLQEAEAKIKQLEKSLRNCKCQS